MKKILVLILCMSLLFGFSACSSDEDSSSGSKEVFQEGDTAMATTTQVTGQVVEIYGNQLTLQLATMGKNTSGQGDMSQRGETGEMPEGEMPSGEGMTGGKNSGMEGNASGEQSSARGTTGTGEGMQGGQSGQGGMSGGMTGDVDLSQSITLSDETQEYSIPVDTPVTQYGTEMTFSQITAEMYITITLNEDGNIVAVSILG